LGLLDLGERESWGLKEGLLEFEKGSFNGFGQVKRLSYRAPCSLIERLGQESKIGNP
jgi:hypothetical protein